MKNIQRESMTTPILIDLTIEKDSKVCNFCNHLAVDKSGSYPIQDLCTVFDRLFDAATGRLDRCLHAQHRAEDLMSNGC